MQINNIAVEIARKNDQALYRVGGAAAAAEKANTEQYVCGLRACFALLSGAKFFALAGTKEDLGTAKTFYRLIITTYTGPAYTSYVKQAEFGLEDLKDQKPHK
ncbi:MAG: hypothetical protein ABSG91_19825 [Syntrophobacteraceae bacterium]|jgi:hypothetical protein